MLILYDLKFSKKYFKKICKINNIKNYSNLSKQNLLLIINKHKSAIYIQTFFRKKNTVEDWICAITYNNLKYPFISIKNNNTFRYYNLHYFVEYLNKSSGNFIDPYTRELLSNSCIEQIEKLIKYFKIKKKLNKNTWNKKINSRAEFLTITNYLNDVLNQLFYQHSLNFNFIYNTILPQFIYYFNFLLLKHKNNCFIVINNYINCINHHRCNNKIYIIDYLKLIININNL